LLTYCLLRSSSPRATSCFLQSLVTRAYQKPWRSGGQGLTSAGMRKFFNLAEAALPMEADLAYSLINLERQGKSGPPQLSRRKI